MKKQFKLVKERNIALLVDQKKMKKEKKEMEKNKKEHEENLRELRDVNSDLEKHNATLKIKLKGKDDLIKGLKELSGIDESVDMTKKSQVLC